jgi:D-3-phosphoglycerate dehydrogenase
LKKILVAADSYVPPEAFKKAFQRIAPENQIRYIQMVEAGRIANSPSEKTIREFTGDPAQIVGELKDEEILAVHTAPVTDEVLQASPNLKLVCCARGGPVNIDIASATKRGILVVSAPGRNADAVADYVLGVMIILARNLRNANLFLVQKKKFDRSTFASFFGHELGGRTLGLIGYGNVGSRVAKRAVAFGMSVLVYDPYIESSKIDAPGIKATDFDTVLRQSDFVSVHARESKENENLIGKRQF